LNEPFTPFIAPVRCGAGSMLESFAPIFVACDLHISTALDVVDVLFIEDVFVIGVYDFVFAS
jgi:hypothetical protein